MGFLSKFIMKTFQNNQDIIENDADDMSIYEELDDKVVDICSNHGFNVQTRVGNDLAYYAIFVADDRLPKVQEAIQMLEELGLRKIDAGTFKEMMHYYAIDFSQINKGV